jgi:hypothetical protein
MVDSESVAVAGDVPAGASDLLAVDQACGKGEEAQRDSGAEQLRS